MVPMNVYFSKKNSRLNIDGISSISSICGMLLIVTENTFTRPSDSLKQINMHTIMHCKDALTIRVFIFYILYFILYFYFKKYIYLKYFYLFFKWMKVWLLVTPCKTRKDTTHMPHTLLLVSLHEFHAKKAGLSELNGHRHEFQIHSQRAIYYKHDAVDLPCRLLFKCHCKHLYPVGRTDGIWWYIEVVLDFNVYIVLGSFFPMRGSWKHTACFQS